MSTLGHYFHTLRHMRPGQVTARLRSHLHQSRVDLRPAPPLRRVERVYVEPIPPLPSLVGPHTFRLLNVQRDCAGPADWRPPDADKLWIYNLHYFDDLNAENAQSRVVWHETLLARWVAEVPAGYADAWEPYPVSRRIVNWIKWALRGNTLVAQWRDSLATQARWLVRRLEYHLLANHLFANAKALLYAGLYFDRTEAEDWRSRALRILEQQIPEQVLADGGHFERSPMYHATMLEDVLDLINVQQAYGFAVPRAWHDATLAMRRWLHALTHPDGDIAFFNDSAFDIAPRPGAIEQYAARLGMHSLAGSFVPLLLLEQSGYARLESGRAHLLCACGGVGPDYQPGHAHADTLSFELSLDGQRLLVNSGTSRYGTGTERDRQRGTAAHNTVVVEGENSSEVWAGFRVARRARARIHEVSTQQQLRLVASHDGYRRLPGRNQHRRSWLLGEVELCIVDEVSGAYGSAVAFFHLHPLIDALANGAAVTLSRSGATVAVMSFEGAAVVEVAAGTWHPRFGVSHENRFVRASFAGGRLVTRIRWSPAPDRI